MTKHHRSTRISTRIADGIKRDIVTGLLQSGDRLPAERTMVTRHRVSRVSVREAYRALQDIGLVSVRRGSAGGAFIAAPNAGRLGEALSLAVHLDEATDRQVLEASLVQPLVAALAARHATAEDLARLRKIVSVPARTLRNAGLEAHCVRFQAAVADGAHNILLASVVASLASISGTRLRHLGRQEGSISVVMEKHETIEEAIARRDERGASQAMLAYCQWLNDVLLQAESGPDRRTGSDPAGVTISAA